MDLSKADKLVLESFCSLADALADYLGSGCEIVLHSLENPDESVIKIVNGHHTGRNVGAPVTDLALGLLSEIEKDAGRSSVCYFTKNRSGEPLKSTTIAIRGEGGRVIGLLCLNFYLAIPLSEFLGTFFPGEDNVPIRHESFLDSSEELIKGEVMKAREEAERDPAVLPSLKNRAAVCILYKRGLFNMKNAVELVAKGLGISKNTVYMHLRFAKNGENLQE